MTLAELKRRKTFKVIKRFSGKYHAGNHDELKADILETLKDAGLDPSKLTESESYFHYENRTWFKPRILKEDTGTITMRSKDYVFKSDTTGRDSFGDLPKAKDMAGLSFKIIVTGGETITYTILDNSL